MSFKPGDALPSLAAPDITVTRIAQVMDVMDDNNPVHIDEELVKTLGLRGLVNQGPCNLAYITNMLTAWAGNPDAVRRFHIRFHNMVCPGDKLTAEGRVAAIHRGTPSGATSRIGHGSPRRCGADGSGVGFGSPGQ